MPKRQISIISGIMLSLCLFTSASFAQMDTGDGFGQTIQVMTRLHTFITKASWLLVIRDIDHDQNIPYLYDFYRGDNYWVALTYGDNYLIVASTLQIETYQSRYNGYKKYKIHNFCNLESFGRIIRGESMYLTIEGDLTQYPENVRCTVSRYPNATSLAIVDP